MILNSREEAALIRGNHVLNVDISILSTVFLHQLKCLLDQIAHVVLVLL